MRFYLSVSVCQTSCEAPSVYHQTPRPTEEEDGEKREGGEEISRGAAAAAAASEMEFFTS